MTIKVKYIPVTDAGSNTDTTFQVKSRTVPGTTDTLLAADDGAIVKYTASSPVTLTLPSDLPADWNVTLLRSVSNTVAPFRSVPYQGISIGGFEFGNVQDTSQFGYNYGPWTLDNVDYWVGLGLNTFRLPFVWERMQPTLGGPIFSDYANRYLELVNHVVNVRGCYAVLDCHNYAGRFVNGTKVGIRTPQLPANSLGDLWLAMLNYSPIFRHAKCIYDLMNEPIAQGAWVTDVYVPEVNDAIAKIRTAGQTNLILIEGTLYAQAYGWSFDGSQALNNVIVDPANNHAFQAHQYWDYLNPPFSGTNAHTAIGNFGRMSLVAFRQWGKKYNKKLWLGEFSPLYDTTTPQASVDAARNAFHEAFQEMNANRDVFIGWTAWTGGQGYWDDAFISLDPWNGQTTTTANDFVPGPASSSKDKALILQRYSSPADHVVWEWPGATIDLDLVHNRAFGATITGCLTTPRTTTVSARSEGTHYTIDDGPDVSFAPGVIRQTDKGLYIQDKSLGDNFIPTQDFSLPIWNVQSTGATVTQYTDPADGVTYFRLQGTANPAGMYLSTLHNPDGWQAIDVKSLKTNTDGLMNMQFWTGANLVPFSIGPGGTYPHGSWVRPSAATVGGNGINFGYASGPCPMDLLLRNAKINTGPAPTPYSSGAGTEDIINIVGPLLTAMQGDFTLVVSMRSVALSRLAPILSVNNGVSALERTATNTIACRLATAFGTGTNIPMQFPDNIYESRRFGLSVRRNPGRIVIAESTIGALASDQAVPAITSARLGSQGTTFANAICERVILIPSFKDTAALAALCR